MGVEGHEGQAIQELQPTLKSWHVHCGEQYGVFSKNAKNRTTL